jgi:hypothetical protein
MNIVAKIAYILMRSEMPLERVWRVMTEARDVEQTRISEVHQLLAENLAAEIEGGPDALRQGRVLERRKCIEALERIRNWNSGGEDEAVEIMSWNEGGEDDPPPSIGEYADWVLRYG